ncbi:PP2C family protein-serine/threonine phosphatase [Tengunoibacter tsumagoiensis]|uniref:Serine/threonine phosphatase n=1 Tax=Tengunoibacter tsumagoiensis TaxID=2014871 RepID=A0A402AAS4_9CHLR|nr:PP2C family serine/threonine-protein phosphatase [Tengunoibacter tsumagoiensis]GCE16146.1 serine/threonine phosphatase [Tengunoibacter tsumagoiensis]
MVADAGKKTTRRAADNSSTAFTYARHSVPHVQHSERNEDALLVDEKHGLAAVFDGVGSNQGQIASRLAVRTLRSRWRHVLDALVIDEQLPCLSCEQLEISSVIQQLISEVNQEIILEGDRLAGKGTRPQARPATTMALIALCAQTGQQSYTMTYAHAGDSRIYLLRETEHLLRLTEDDGYFSLLLREGALTPADIIRIDQALTVDQLTHIERSYFDKRNGITQALGDKDLALHLDQIQIFPGDRVLICSDGIHDNLIDEEIETIMRSATRTRVAYKLVMKAIQRSLENGGSLRAKNDDMSAIVISCHR